MEKINVAELLKDCPEGMDLDCTILDNIVFDGISNCVYPIKVITKDRSKSLNLTKYGCTSENKNAKCVIFPKGKTTWEGFQRPFKEGDIVINDSNKGSNPFIYKSKNKDYYECYAGLTFGSNPNLIKGSSTWVDISCELRFATEEEKEKLFDAIKANGYRWNSDTKTLEKLPRFKVGDRIVKKNGICVPILITKVSDEFYYSNTKSSVGVLSISEQDEYELVPDKFDITTLKPFESKVLVWEDQCRKWIPAFWGSKCDSGGYITTYGWCKYCIPFDGNEHLMGTSKDCDKFYKTWK